MKYFIFVIQLLLVLFFTSFWVYSLNQNFLLCPNKDMLLWDANIRMIQSIDFLSYLRVGEFFSAVKLILDSPTWPPLRSLISAILILLNGQPDPILDTRVSIVFFFLEILAIFFGTLYFFYEEYKNHILNRILLFLSIYLSITFLFLLDQIPEYLFNSMLEIQGMFFYTFFLFLIYYIYKNNLYSNRLKILFFITGFLIYFTKYPYGVLVSFSFFFIELLQDPKNFLREVHKLIDFYKNYRMVFILLPVLGIFLIFISPRISLDLIKTKFIKNFIYITILISFVELNLFLYKHKIKLFSDSFRFYYLYFIFPFSVVILSHPDRFHSLLGAQSDIIDRGRSFFISIFYDYFINSYGFSVLVILSFTWIVYLFITRKDILKNYPILYVILFLWIHFVILEFLTTNHQARYIFQVIPGLILFHTLVFLYMSEKQKVVIVVLLSLLFLSNVYYIKINPPSTRKICFAGYDQTLFEPARIIPKLIPENTKGIIFNEFHEYKKANINLDNPYLLIPTDIDVHIRYKTYKNGFVLNYSKYFISNQNIQNFIYITNHCKNELYQSPFFDLKNLNKNLKTILVDQIDEFICLKIYEIE